AECPCQLELESRAKTSCRFPGTSPSAPIQSPALSPQAARCPPPQVPPKYAKARALRHLSYRLVGPCIRNKPKGKRTHTRGREELRRRTLRSWSTGWRRPANTPAAPRLGSMRPDTSQAFAIGKVSDAYRRSACSRRGPTI